MKEQAYDTLRELILIGKLVPGQPVVEAQIAPLLGTSKTPVREALLRLEAEGLVTLSPYKGGRVAKLSLRELQDLQFVRWTLEVAAAKLTADRIAPGTLARARACLDRMQEETAREEWDGYRESHREFHAILFDAAGNRVLAKMLLDLFDQMQRYSKFCLQWNAAYWTRDEEDHHAALAAIERKEVGAFEAIFGRMNASFLAYVEQALRRNEGSLASYFEE